MWPDLINATSHKHPQNLSSTRDKLIFRAKHSFIELNSFTFGVMCCLVFCGSCVVFICLFLIPALSDSQSNFLLNGNFVVAMFKREITFKGIVIEYSGSDTKVERINCTDRIEEELVLQVAHLFALHLHTNSYCTYCYSFILFVLRDTASVL